MARFLIAGDERLPRQAREIKEAEPAGGRGRDHEAYEDQSPEGASPAWREAAAEKQLHEPDNGGDDGCLPTALPEVGCELGHGFFLVRALAVVPFSASTRCNSAISSGVRSIWLTNCASIGPAAPPKTRARNERLSDLMHCSRRTAGR